MKTIDISEVYQFIQDHIDDFHISKLNSLNNTSLKELLKKKNPYLFRVKNILTAEELVKSLLDAKMSSSEEELFGAFLENLAIFIAQRTLDAIKSSSHGIDFEYSSDKTRYLVTLKSGLNWGNSSQWKALESDFKTAMTILRQSLHITNINCILGICYGNAKTTIRKGIIMQVCGQNFWYMVTGSETFYKDIVQPLGHRAKESNESFDEKKAEIVNRLTGNFIGDFCDPNGKILWEKVVEFNSGNITDNDRERLL
ncbi:MAG: PmeII family type II restriction endonuclease [Candidatus Poribacteria bacterium]